MTAADASDEPTVFAQALLIAAVTASAAYGTQPEAIAAVTGGGQAELGDPAARVPHAAMVRCWTALSRGRDDFGIQAARRVGLAPRTLVDYAMLSAPDVGGALATFVRFQRWMHDAAAHRLELDDSQAVLRFGLAPPWRVPTAVWEFLATTAVLRLRVLAGEAGRPTRVWLPRPPHEEPDAVAALLGAEVVYEAKLAGVAWPREALRRSLVQRDDALHLALSRQLEVALGLPPVARAIEKPPPEEEQVALRRALASALLRGEVGLEAIARALGTSGRSLQRRLLARGTSFQAELEAVRRALAERLMAEPGASVKAVAFAVGFTQVSAFTRAFRRWTGQAPASYLRARRVS